MITRNRHRAVIATAAALAFPAAASGATVGAVTTCNVYGMCSTAVTFQAGPGEANDVLAALEPACQPALRCVPDEVTIRDAAPLVAGAGCRGSGVVTCSVRGPAYLDLRLEDGTDRLATAGPMGDFAWRVHAHGGSGGDVLTSAAPGALRGEGGDDILAAGAPGSQSSFEMSGGDGDDTLDATQAVGDGRRSMWPGAGEDVVRGGVRGEIVSAADGEPDVIDCGGSTGVLDVDRASVDSFDTVVNCMETTTYEPDDGAPPASAASAPATSASTAISVGYAASDPAPSSGIRSVQLWAKAPGQDAYFYAGSAAEPSGAFAFEAAAGDGTYAFYTIATDRSGNREAAPAAPDASTRVDTTAPEIVAVSPSDGASRVAPSATVSATFSEAVDRGAAEAAFSLARADGAAVGGTFSWNGATMTFRPDARLAAGTAYTATVTTGARDEAGNHLAAAGTWRFRTR